LQIEPYMQRKPKALSGGQRQRVAIGRAIVREPKLFLFDEPLSNLDAELRVQMRVELSKLHADLGATMIYVTHDQVEAMTMADRIVVLREGRIEQAGTPLDLYNRPANRFVAGFIGSPKMNFISARHAATVGDACAFDIVGGGRLVLPAGSVANPPGDVVIGIRPEHVQLVPDGMPLSVTLTEQLGGNSVLYGMLGGNQPLVVQLVGQSQVKRGDVVGVQWPEAACHVFDNAGRALTSKALGTQC
jgi:multiple sugar transport system ATP-binding protein